MEISELLKAAVDMGASDLHIAVGKPPVFRIDGVLKSVSDDLILTPAETKRLIYSILNDFQKQKFEEQKELDFSLSIARVSRFRVNIHFQRGSVAAAFRVISSIIKNFEELSLPVQVMEQLSRRPSGIVLITGPTGSGKSTTLAAMVDVINEERECHLITVEDPIEYLHPHKKCLIEQREVNEDTYSFANALKFILRQDPDVILIGELRDLETISAALTAAETGHLVLTTLHTNDVVQTIDRIIDVFPSHQQAQIRIQLASVVQGIICQKLLPSLKGKGREIALEIMIGTDAIRSMIREGKTHQIYSLIEAGGQYMMQTMDRALVNLYKARRINKEVVLLNAKKTNEVERYLVS